MNDLREAIERAFLDEPPMPDPVDQIISARHRRRTRRQCVSGVSVLGVAAAAVAVVVVPSLLGGAAPSLSPTAAAAMRTLAAAASHGPAAPAPAHRYLLVLDRTEYAGETDIIKTWVARDGLHWIYHSPNQNTPAFVTWGGNDTSEPSLAYLKSLPETGPGLYGYLNSHVTGSSTKDEAFFEAVGDIQRFGGTPPALRAAGFEVLEHTPHISVKHTKDALGRRALKVTFTDPTGQSGPESLLFDPKTAALIGEQDGPHFVATYTDKIVRTVPAAVRKQAGALPPRPTPPPPLSQKPSPRPSWSS